MKTVRISPSRTVALVTRCWPHAGPACWILAVQFFVAQIAVALSVKSVYNWGTDPISYLGITECIVFSGDYVCSPLHAVFNLSLIGLGVAVAAGAFLLYHQVHNTLGTRAGFSAMAVAALGTLLVGVFPPATFYAIHSFGTGLAFVGGLAGIFCLSVSLRDLPRALRYVMGCASAIALTGLVLLALFFFLGIDFKGAAERIATYPVVLWLIVFGVYTVVRHVVARRAGPPLRQR